MSKHHTAEPVPPYKRDFYRVEQALRRGVDKIANRKVGAAAGIAAAVVVGGYGLREHNADALDAYTNNPPVEDVLSGQEYENLLAAQVMLSYAQGYDPKQLSFYDVPVSADGLGQSAYEVAENINGSNDLSEKQIAGITVTSNSIVEHLQENGQSGVIPAGSVYSIAIIQPLQPDQQAAYVVTKHVIPTSEVQN